MERAFGGEYTHNQEDLCVVSCIMLLDCSCCLGLDGVAFLLPYGIHGPPVGYELSLIEFAAATVKQHTAVAAAWIVF